MRNKTQGEVWVIGTNSDVGELLDWILARYGIAAKICAEWPSSVDRDRPKAIIVDRRSAELNGGHSIADFRELAPEIPIVLMATECSVEVLGNPVQPGTHDFVALQPLEDRLVATFEAIGLGVGSQPSTPPNMTGRRHEPTQIGSAEPRRCFQPVECKTMDQIERDAIQCALVRCNGSAVVAARALGISTATIYRKLKRYSNS